MKLTFHLEVMVLSREIKFRAWDKERKEMRQVQLMDWSDWWISTGHTWERDNSLEYGERNSFKNESTDRHVLMQYIGLKDKNGVEIYEGDILEFHRAGYPNKPHFLIEFQNGGFQLQSLHPEYDDEFISEMEMEYAEVIGNQYDNPDLVTNI